MSWGTHTDTFPTHISPAASVAVNDRWYTRPSPGTLGVPARSARRFTEPSVMSWASGDISPSPKPLTGSSCMTFVTATVNGVPSGSTTPTTATLRYLWFGGQRMAGDADAASQTGGLFSILQVAEHPSPFNTLPSSHSSGGWMTPSPQAMGETASPRTRM